MEVSKSAMIICNSAHAYGLLYLSLKGKVAIYLMAWAIAILLADGSFHNLYSGEKAIVPRQFIIILITYTTSGNKLVRMPMVFEKFSMTRNNPANWIILIDQSVDMDGLVKGKSVSKATIATSFINKLIDFLIAKNYDGEAPKNRCFISVIGYNHDVKELCSGWLKDLDENPLRYETAKVKQYDGNGGIRETEVKCPIWVEVTAQKDASAKEVALGEAKERLWSWLTKTKSSFPIIFNMMPSWHTLNCNFVTFNTEWQHGKSKYLQVDIIINDDFVRHLFDVLQFPFKLYVDGGGPFFCDNEVYKRFYEFNTLDDDIQCLKGCMSLKFDVLEK